jgi:all-trans-retinol dehydrogenase (NAD+)
VDLAHKTVLITGAARGIGQATALRCARHGAHILGVDLEVGAMRDTAAAVQSAGQEFRGYACDVSDAAAVNDLVEQAAATERGFDVVINNAGVAPSGPYGEDDFATWQRTIQVNLIGLMALTHAALPYLRTRFRAHIVNVASVAGKVGSPGLVAYCASKHGVVGFTEALRAELVMQGASVGVSCILSSMADTRMTRGVRRSGLIPLVQPEDVATAIVDAIEENLPEVYVPARMRWLVDVLPTVAPGVARWLALHDETARGWLEARKPLPKLPAPSGQAEQ